MAKMTKYFKRRAMIMAPSKEVKYKIAWWLKIILLFTFPLWIIPFLITNGWLGLIMRNVMQNFQRVGRIENPNFVKIDVNTLEFYNRDMELNHALQLMIDETTWNMMKPQDITITTFDNYQLSAFFIVNHQLNNNHKWIIATHGWQQNRYSILYLVKHFYEQGYSIVTYDTRGHGNNNANAITFGAKEANDLYAVIQYFNNYLQQNNCNQLINITLIGNSMGANIALETVCGFDVVNLGVKCVIFDCGYDNFSHVIKLMSKKYFKIHWCWTYFGVKCFFKIKDKLNINDVNTINKLQYCANIPVLFIHGKDDATIPVMMTQRMYETKISYETQIISELLIILKTRHLRAITTDYSTYCKTTLKFIDKWTNNKKL